MFAFVSDVANEVHWRTGVTEPGLIAESPLRVGPEGYDLAGRTRATWRVVAFGDSTAVDWVLTSRPFGGTGGYHVEPDHGGTRFTLVADVEPANATLSAAHFQHSARLAPVN